MRNFHDRQQGNQPTANGEDLASAVTGRAFAVAGALMQLAIGAGTAIGAPLVGLLHADGAMLTAGGLTIVPALVAPHEHFTGMMRPPKRRSAASRVSPFAGEAQRC